MDARSAIAPIRFGLGPRMGDGAVDDPRAWLLDQLAAPDAPRALPEGWDHLPTTLDAFEVWRDDRDYNRAQRERTAAMQAGGGSMSPGTAGPGNAAAGTMSGGAAMPGSAGASGGGMADAGGMAPGGMAGGGTTGGMAGGNGMAAGGGSPGAAPPVVQAYRVTPRGQRIQVSSTGSLQLFGAERKAWMGQLITTDQPFRERLVSFWLNHFTVSRRESLTGVFAGPMMREAIRPHLTGRFADMVVAVTRHPAMILYLNQNTSVGPNSQRGLQRHLGLNENLAREVMELHTLSPAAGYSQEDVTSFARLLTGLNIEATKDPMGVVFRPELHEPGTKTIMGRTFAPGEASIEEALRWLADHPATHKHLAIKLARHFVADDPPPAAVAKLEGVLRDTGGDLGATSRMLVTMEESWTTPLNKLRAPQDYVVSCLRALGADAGYGEFAANICTVLNQPPWIAPQPNGWGDTAADWVTPEGMLQRIDQAHGMTGRFSRLDSKAVLDTVLGPLARPETQQAVMRAGSNRDALTLILGSPEFQRR
ncbi:DUF1800 domain-containing protein [Roseomonas elaeocarpi]|uniref:DUF1800 family protein n=1 Tax=Roseomonas elaeocarpi TaxID=907779 RepID=A0ABV6JWF6_9PROT